MRYRNEKFFSRTCDSRTSKSAAVHKENVLDQVIVHSECETDIPVALIPVSGVSFTSQLVDRIQ
jgi:hypothetical protein